MAEFSSDIIKFVGQGVQLKVFLKNGNEHVGGHGTPDLRLECALACDQKLLDAQVLFYPIEKQLDLPTVEWRPDSAGPWTAQSLSTVIASKEIKRSGYPVRQECMNLLPYLTWGS